MGKDVGKEPMAPAQEHDFLIDGNKLKRETSSEWDRHMHTQTSWKSKHFTTCKYLLLYWCQYYF